MRLIVFNQRTNISRKHGVAVVQETTCKEQSRTLKVEGTHLTMPVLMNVEKEEFMFNLMTEADLSKELRVSIALLRRWRLEKRGPLFIKVGALVRYRPEDIQSWLGGLPTGGERTASSGAEDLKFQQLKSAC
jgi:hypothetical protein